MDYSRDHPKSYDPFIEGEPPDDIAAVEWVDPNDDDEADRAAAREDPPDDERRPDTTNIVDDALLAWWMQRIRAQREAQRLLDDETVNLDAIPPPRTLRESIEHPPPGEPVRIETLTVVAGRTTIVGARKVGKTTFLGNLLRALLTGLDFLGRYPVRTSVAAVFVLNYEMHERQFTAWLTAQGLDEYGDRLHVWHLRGHPNPLRTAKGRAMVAAALADVGAGALVVDTFGRAFYGQSQSDAADVARFLAELDEIAGRDRDVYLTVHAGWVGERSRGSSALEDWPDTILTLADDDGIRYLSAIGRDVDEVTGSHCRTTRRPGCCPSTPRARRGRWRKPSGATPTGAPTMSARRRRRCRHATRCCSTCSPSSPAVPVSASTTCAGWRRATQTGRCRTAPGSRTRSATPGRSGSSRSGSGRGASIRTRSPTPGWPRSRPARSPYRFERFPVIPPASPVSLRTSTGSGSRFPYL